MFHGRVDVVNTYSGRSAMSRLYAIEAHHSATGVIADHRIAVRGSQLEAIAVLAHQVEAALRDAGARLEVAVLLLQGGELRLGVGRGCGGDTRACGAEAGHHDERGDPGPAARGSPRRP